MQVQLLKSKIHRAAVTDANVNYEGSLTVDRALMEEVGLLPYERVLCGNMGNGERFETYAIPGESGSGAIILNGATAHLGKTGDRLTIMSFATVDEAEIAGWKPKVIVLDEHNGIIAAVRRFSAPTSNLTERLLPCVLQREISLINWAEKCWETAPCPSPAFRPPTAPARATSPSPRTVPSLNAPNKAQPVRSSSTRILLPNARS